VAQELGKSYTADKMAFLAAATDAELTIATAIGKLTLSFNDAVKFVQALKIRLRERPGRSQTKVEELEQLEQSLDLASSTAERLFESLLGRYGQSIQLGDGACLLTRELRVS
jgi:hypothetical protein